FQTFQKLFCRRGDPFLKKYFPHQPLPKNFSYFRGKTFPLKTPFTKLLLLKTFLEKGFQTFQKLFFSEPFSKKGSAPPKTSSPYHPYQKLFRLNKRYFIHPTPLSRYSSYNSNRGFWQAIILVLFLISA
ncbi:MAG: hypothetical protein D6805_09830, partial [Planctomycetota bacterium]